MSERVKTKTPEPLSGGTGVFSERVFGYYLRKIPVRPRLLYEQRLRDDKLDREIIIGNLLYDIFLLL